MRLAMMLFGLQLLVPVLAIQHEVTPSTVALAMRLHRDEVAPPHSPFVHHHLALQAVQPGREFSNSNRSNATSIATTGLLHLQHLESGAGSVWQNLIKPAVMQLRQPKPFGSKRDELSASSSVITPAEEIGVTQNQFHDGTYLVSASIFSLVTCVGFTFAFWQLQKAYPEVYERTATDECPQGADLDRGSGFFGLVRRIDALTAEDVIPVAGLDAWMLMQLHKTLINILVHLAPFLLVIAALHYFEGRLVTDNFFKDNDDFLSPDLLSRVGIEHLEIGSRYFWVHAVAVWIVMCVTLHHMFQAHRRFLDLRCEWLMSLPAPQSKTLLLEGIPQQYRSENALRGFFTSLFPEAKIDRIFLVRNTQFLRKLWQEEQAAYFAHMLEVAKFRQHGRRNTLDYSRADVTLRQPVVEALSRFRAARAATTAERKRVNDSAADGEIGICAHAAFVTFTTRRWKVMAENGYLAQDDQLFTTRPAPEPRDVLWHDLMQEPLEKPFREAIGGILLLGIFMMWFPVVVFVSGLTNLDALQERMPVIEHIRAQSPFMDSFVQGVISTLAVKVFIAFLPSAMLFITEQCWTLRAGAVAQLNLQKWYFGFQVVFIVLVTSVGRSLHTTVMEVINHPLSMFSVLATTLPNVSHFYLNYLVLGWVVSSFRPIRFMNLIKYIFFRHTKFLGVENAKAASEPENQADHGMGSRTAVAMLMATIAIVWCPCSPLIGVVGLVYFRLSGLSLGYLLYFVETKKPDLGGVFWVESCSELFYVLFLYICLMIGVLLQRAETGHPACIAMLALPYLYLANKRFHELKWESLPYNRLMECDHRDAKAGDEELRTTRITRASYGSMFGVAEVSACEYVQPECSDGFEDIEIDLCEFDKTDEDDESGTGGTTSLRRSRSGSPSSPSREEVHEKPSSTA